MHINMHVATYVYAYVCILCICTVVTVHIDLQLVVNKYSLLPLNNINVTMEIPQLRSIYVFATCFVELIICLCYNIISLLT